MRIHHEVSPVEVGLIMQINPVGTVVGTPVPVVEGDTVVILSAEITLGPLEMSRQPEEISDLDLRALVTSILIGERESDEEELERDFCDSQGF